MRFINNKAINYKKLISDKAVKIKRVTVFKKRGIMFTSNGESIFTVPNGINGQLSDCRLTGNSVFQSIQNGNFVNTTSWTGLGATLSATNNVLSVTASGGSAYGIVNQDSNIATANGKKIFIRAKAKITNSNCTKIEIRIFGTVANGTVQIITLNTPSINVQNVISGIVTMPADSTGNIAVRVVHYYADAATASGKVMELQEVMAIDLDANGLSSLTLAECNARFPYWLKSGTVSTLSLRATIAKNIFGGERAANKIIAGINNVARAYKTSIDGRNCIALNGGGGMGKAFATNFEPNTQYTIQLYMKRGTSGQDGGVLGIQYTDGTTYWFMPTADGWTKYTYTTTSGKTVANITASYGTATTNYIDYDTLQVEKGTTATTVDQSYSEAYTPAVDAQGNPIILRCIRNAAGVIIAVDEFNASTGEAKFNVGEDKTVIKGATFSIEASGTTMRRFLATVNFPNIPTYINTQIANAVLYIGNTQYKAVTSQSIATDVTPYSFAIQGTSIRITDDSADLSAFYAKLASNQVVLIDKLALPIITHTSKTQKIRVKAGDTFIIEPNPLIRELPNGVKDEVSLSEGWKKQNVSDDVVLNGNLNWILSTTLTNTYALTIAHGLTNAVTQNANAASATSNDGNYDIGVSSGTDTRNLAIHSNGFYYLHVEKSKVDAQAGADTLAKFKSYLNAFPISVNYQLLTPIITDYSSTTPIITLE